MEVAGPAGDSTAAFLMDTENLFYSFGFSENGLRRALGLALMLGQKATADEYDPEQYRARAGKALTSVLAWAEERVGSRLDARNSYGKNSDPGVQAVAPFFQEHRITHKPVGGQKHAAETELIRVLHAIRDTHSSFVFGGIDIKVRVAVMLLVEAGWTREFLFIAPPAAGSLRDSATGTYKALTAAPGAILCTRGGETKNAPRYFAYLHEICVPANIASKRSTKGKVARKIVSQRYRETAGKGSISTSRGAASAPAIKSLPEEAWNNAATKALAAKLPIPTDAEPLGSREWRDHLAQSLAKTPNLLSVADDLADLLNSVYNDVPPARLALDELLLAENPRKRWGEWSAGAILFPRARDAKRRPGGPPLDAYFDAAKSWIPSSP